MLEEYPGHVYNSSSLHLLDHLNEDNGGREQQNWTDHSISKSTVLIQFLCFLLFLAVSEFA